MSFFDDVASVATFPITGPFQVADGISSATGGSNPLSSASNDVIQPIISGITGALGPAITGIGQALAPAIGSIGGALAGGLSTAFSAQDQTWKQNALSQIPNIQQASYPGFKSYLDSNGQLPSNLQVNPNTQAISALRTQATQTGPSAFTQNAQTQLNSALPGQITDANRFQSGALTNTKNYMAGEGGISTGLSNNLNQQSGISGMLADQDLRQANKQGNQDLLLGDAQAKQAAQTALPGLELQQTQPQQANISNTLGQLSAQNAADVARYQQQMQSWSTANVAGATAKSGKK